MVHGPQSSRGERGLASAGPSPKVPVMPGSRLSLADKIPNTPGLIENGSKTGVSVLADAFLEAEIDRLSAAVSSGFVRGKVPLKGREEKNTQRSADC